MIDLQVQIDKRQMAAAQGMLRAVPKGWPRVASRALNKVATWARSRVVKGLAAELGLRQSYIRKKHTRLRRATWRHLGAAVRVEGRKRIRLIEFHARQTARGVSYRIGKGGGRKRIAHAFIATMPGGHTGVYVRTGAKRLPIAERFGPSVMQVFEKGMDAGREIVAQSHTRLGMEIDRQVGVLLERAGK